MILLTLNKAESIPDDRGFPTIQSRHLAHQLNPVRIVSLIREAEKGTYVEYHTVVACCDNCSHLTFRAIAECSTIDEFFFDVVADIQRIAHHCLSCWKHYFPRLEIQVVLLVIFSKRGWRPGFPPYRRMDTNASYPRG